MDSRAGFAMLQPPCSHDDDGPAVGVGGSGAGGVTLPDWYVSKCRTPAVYLVQRQRAAVRIAGAAVRVSPFFLLPPAPSPLLAGVWASRWLEMVRVPSIAGLLNGFYTIFALCLLAPTASSLAYLSVATARCGSLRTGAVYLRSAISPRRGSPTGGHLGSVVPVAWLTLSVQVLAACCV